jgi:L-fuconolactonase
MLHVERGARDANSGGMMRVDAHQHFWRFKAKESRAGGAGAPSAVSRDGVAGADPGSLGVGPQAVVDDYGWIDDSMSALRRDFLPPESLREMASIQFDACVAVQARQTLEETRWLLALAGEHPSIAGVVGWIDLQAGAAIVGGQIASFAANSKLVGIRHIVQAEPDDRFLLRSHVLEGLAALSEFGLAFDLLIYPRHLPVATECVARLPQQRFVLDHLAKPPIRAHEIDEWERDIRALARHPNVLAKLSGLVTEADWHTWTADHLRPYLDVAFDAFGWHRLMIGSDWPVSLVAGSYSCTMRVILDYIASRPADERDAILGGNAQRFWGLKADEAHLARADRATPLPGSL